MNHLRKNVRREQIQVPGEAMEATTINGTTGAEFTNLFGVHILPQVVSDAAHRPSGTNILLTGVWTCTGTVSLHGPFCNFGNGNVCFVLLNVASV